MRLPQTDSVLKGVYLALLFLVAALEPDWNGLILGSGLMLAGLVLALALAGWQRMRDGYKPDRKPFSFLAFTVLENPSWIDAGLAIGLAAGGLVLARGSSAKLLVAALLAGGMPGVLCWFLGQLKDCRTRIACSLAAAAIITACLWAWLGLLGDLGVRLRFPSPVQNPMLFGTQVLLGIPIFCLLALCGNEKEPESDAAMVCVCLAVGVGMLGVDKPSIQVTGIIVAVMLYFWYTLQAWPRLRAYREIWQGYAYQSRSRHLDAILSFRRALAADPLNKLARDAIWRVHGSLDLSRLGTDTDTRSILDLDLCLERARALLLGPGPSPARLQEARQLLELVLSQRPERRPVVHYWRAVAYTHERRFDEACEELGHVLDPSTYLPNDPTRKDILLSAWQLALTSHPELTRRLGEVQLAIPGRRMEAIAAVERHLADHANNDDVWGFKRVLYEGLSESEYNTSAGDGGVATDFDHGYARQVGLALLDQPERWQRGCEYLRIAATGLPAHGPSIFTQVARVHQKHGDGEAAWRYYELAKRAGRNVGPGNLPDDERQIYFAALKTLGDAALTHGRLDLAVENYQLYAEYERAGLETLRTLADLHERRGNPLAALRVTEQALLYNTSDKDFLTRKDRYYYSVLPEDLRARLDLIRTGFDVAYCLRQARTLLDAKIWDVDTLDWAQHLAELVLVVRPANFAAKVLLARAHLRRDEKEEAIAFLEKIRGSKPESFTSGEEEVAWYQACKLLGELYLYDVNRPDLALECLQAFRKSPQSGADTLYKMGQACEKLGDPVRAVKLYKHVVAFEDHPRAPDAHDALARLGAR
jgi:tetratricopeptide (TPR) repeat protein